MTGVSRVRRARAVTLALWSSLIVVLGVWLLGRGIGPAALALLAITALPLLLPLPGLWRTHRRTYRWAPLTLAPAMTWSLTELVANPATQGIAVLAALLAFLALAAVVATLRCL